MSQQEVPSPPLPGAIATSASRANVAEPELRILFVMVAVIVAAAFSIAAAHSPPRIRLLGLFPITVGWLMAMIVVQIARRMKCRIGIFHVATIGLLAFIGLTASTWQSFRLEPVSKPESAGIFAKSFRTQGTSVNPIEMAIADQIRKEGGTPPEDIRDLEVVAKDQSKFARYLARRIRALGAWDSPWPEVFWVCEMLLGTIAAVLVAAQSRPRETGL